VGAWSDSDLVVGDEETRREAREQARRQKQLRIAMAGNWPELERSDLEFGRFFVVHTPTGDLYRIMRGEVYGGGSDRVAAFYVDAAGDAVFLERPTSGPKTLDELHARQARKTGARP
jgi:hypothetical protein